MFSIDVCITTSSDVWDLAAESFTVTIQLTLPEQAGSPITFRKSRTGLLNHKLGQDDGGLVYKGEAGGTLELGRIFVCTFGRGSQRALPLNRRINENAFTTLYPGKPYTIVVTHTPLRFPDIVDSNSGSQPAELEQIQPDFESIGRWPLTHDVGDGSACTFECGISDDAVVSEWWKGTKEDMLTTRPPGTWPDDENQLMPTRHDIIQYNVVRTAKFSLKRSDVQERPL